jgi:hypothetical protein
MNAGMAAYERPLHDLNNVEQLFQAAIPAGSLSHRYFVTVNAESTSGIDSIGQNIPIEAFAKFVRTA